MEGFKSERYGYDPKPAGDQVKVLEYKTKDGRTFTSWITATEHQAMLRYAKMLKKREYLIFFHQEEYMKGVRRRAARAPWEDNYFILIQRGRHTELAYKNRVTGKVYKVIDYKNTGMEITRFTYLRDATTFDV